MARLHGQIAICHPTCLGREKGIFADILYTTIIHLVLFKVWFYRMVFPLPSIPQRPNIFVTSPCNAFSIRRQMMPFGYHSGLDRALHGTGSRLNTLPSFAKATFVPGLQKTVREPKDHSAIRSPVPSRESYRADTACQPVKTASVALARPRQTSQPYFVLPDD
ncbi:MULTISPECIES: hypothetical protein [unclassified Pseudomonas]|uniref:hypothetical protein n=1 Tax=unclassified Pseudomonas TaxID=196821 RepID=UPI00128BC01B|nr:MULTISPECIES: hypothetical protein [unclassified Pseudomonas]MPQ68746.1 hypothetical protein [Pseudomonas sp. MWU12-2323]